MSNPNWGKGKGNTIHKQLEAYAEEDCMTREEYLRWQDGEAAPPETRAPRRERKTVLK